MYRSVVHTFTYIFTQLHLLHLSDTYSYPHTHIYIYTYTYIYIRQYHYKLHSHKSYGQGKRYWFPLNNWLIKSSFPPSQYWLQEDTLESQDCFSRESRSWQLPVVLATALHPQVYLGWSGRGCQHLICGSGPVPPPPRCPLLWLPATLPFHRVVKRSLSSTEGWSSGYTTELERPFRICRTPSKRKSRTPENAETFLEFLWGF